MPDKKTVEKARRALREGKSPSTAAGEFVREEMHHLRDGKHGVSSPEQAIAIGLSKARRAGITADTRKKASAPKKAVAPKKASAPKKGKRAAAKRTAAERSASARKGARTRARNAKARSGS